MHDPPKILAVDDAPENLEILRTRLAAKGYDVITAADGEEGLARARAESPDLVLLDIMMPKLDGIAVLKALKADTALRFVPVVLVTAKADTRDVVAGLEAGADDYLTKPFDQAALVARVRSLLRIKELHDLATAQAARLAEQAEALAAANRSLEERVAAQVAEIERIGRLRRFLPPQLAEIVSREGGAALVSHRREITVVCCDLRGFTALTEASEPEDVMTVLDEYHRAVGELIFRHEGTLERFAGDGVMVIFNDPLPCPDHAARGVRLGLEMRDAMARLAEAWRRRGHEVGFGAAVALGYATLGEIGFDQRREYTAIGSVVSLAHRLCASAKAGQVLISQRVLAAVEPRCEATPVGPLELKGFARPVPAFDAIRWRDA
ncbi:response regulator [Rhodoplanes sp. TEM]|uniref:Response regulator n=1 Tax=Rhodoplanes tepidamans TaxID=200616 RepID=A0ABT5J4V3_RHOTP|nr:MULTISPECIES: response regulator [Rhodoplanes]MDC7784477.1 response regulator [Rhodoplanes tepidamans]MDC7983507.1 response regulator [Rhodoplanes sp. TEM]MDQ0356985.1 class 3 adenylate cyclase/CheY-like chemotaxis protein [Rhodoplanes tepidamans]